MASESFSFPRPIPKNKNHCDEVKSVVSMMSPPSTSSTGGSGFTATLPVVVVAAVVASLTSFLIASSLFAKKSSRDE